MSGPDRSYDVIVISPGIAGAGVAAELGSPVRMAVLKQEARPGHDMLGRSAAVFAQCSGGPAVRILTRSSHEFFDAPPSGLAQSVPPTARDFPISALCRVT